MMRSWPTTWHHIDRFLVCHLTDYWASKASKSHRLLVAEFLWQELLAKKGHITCTTLCLMFVLFSTAVY
ncbi:hypothetical protein Taro_042147 [Colocasia esculenta]|uniref:Uncharacterized protein n=1 Tax=Colocasia esculenta TaxID=4460 RepID=A0A843WXT1_COLES|nr:hypothetical protein [Colocasia esculenta]